MRLLLLVCWAVAALQPPSQRPPQTRAGDAPVTEVEQLRFYSSFWINLHHTLYGAAWDRRPQTGARRPVDPLPGPLTAAFTGDERAAWETAIAFYERVVADRDLRFGRGMSDIKLALADGRLDADVIDTELRATLERTAPIYRRHFWPAHDRRNRAWIASTSERLRSVARDIVPSLERLYGRPWFTAPVRVDVVWVGRDYTTLHPTHATVSTARAQSDWTNVEMVLHEVSHELILGIERELADAFGDRLAGHDGLWHVVQFYMTGVGLQEVLRRRGIAYSPYLYSTGLFDRAWSQYRKTIEDVWTPYIRGSVTRAQTIQRTVAATTTKQGPEATPQP
jgi:hypothetical protein